MFGIGMWELMLILLVALVVFGPKRLPELGRALGKGLSEFRKASYELRDALSTEDAEVKRAQAAPEKSLPQTGKNGNLEVIIIDGEKVEKPAHDKEFDWQG
jgi:sec-independent protein translocase protein TatA